MRDMVMFFAMLAMVPMSLMNGFVAFLLWGYTTVLTPAHYLYGFMHGVRFNFIFAAIALGLLFMGKTRKSTEKMVLPATYWLLVAFFIHASLSTFFAMSPNPLLAIKYDVLLKGFAFVLALPFFVKDRNGVHAVLVMLALGLGLHGVVEGLKYIASGGAHRMNGIPNSSLTDNNLFAVGMVMVLPVIMYFQTVLKYKIGSRLAMIAVVLVILTIIATNSRGGFLALSVLGFWYFSVSRRKGLALVIVFGAVLLVFAVAPESWFERIGSIQTANEDDSFMSRVAAWRVSLSLGLANPVFGAGFSAIQNFWIWDMYKNMPSIINVDVNLYSPHAAHSIYFQVLGDLGFVGLFLYLALLMSVFVNRKKIINLIDKNNRPDLLWANNIANAIFLSLVGFMVGGAGVSLPYYEIAYILICLMATLKDIVEKNINDMV